MMPPKNITSVTRKIHIPSEALSFCCSRVLNCPYSSPVRCTPHSSACQVQAQTTHLPPDRSPAFFNRPREPARAKGLQAHPAQDPADDESRKPPKSPPELLQNFPLAAAMVFSIPSRPPARGLLPPPCHKTPPRSGKSSAA